jgi:ATP-dependent DNA helicase PIF1
MSRATNRTNIKILALPTNAEAEEEQARRQEEKDAKKWQMARVEKITWSENKKESYR